MTIGLLTASVSLPGARSLKDKRSVLRSFKDRLRNDMNISVAETGRQDDCRRGELAVVTVAAEHTVVQQRLAAVADRMRGNPRWVLLDYHTEML